MVSNRKSSKIYEELASRQNYLVVQANDLAKAFGNLKAFEHKVLDYCFSSVTKDSRVGDVFTVHSLDIMKHFGLTKDGLQKLFRDLMRIQLYIFLKHCLMVDVQ